MKKYLNIYSFLLVCAIVLLFNSGSFGVLESSDARYAEISRAMFSSGDYLHPNLLEVHHYHKPPLTYQITSLGYRLFGVNEFGARFFLQLSVLIQLFLIYQLTFLLFSSKKTALWASVIYFSFPLVLISARNLTTDSFLTTFALLSIYSWTSYRKLGKIYWLYLFTISLGLGFLVKGPVILIVPIIYAILYNRIETNKHSFNYHHVLSWLLFLTISASWFVYLILENNDFFNYFFKFQTVDRFAKNEAFGRSEPFWYYLLLAPLAGFPWFLILFYLLKNERKRISKNTIQFVLTLSTFIPIIFFTISSSKRILYILPIYVITAILTANLFSKINEKKLKYILKLVLIYASIIILGLIIISLFITELDLPKLSILFSLLIAIIVFVIVKSKLDNSIKTIGITFSATVLLLVGFTYLLSNNLLKFNSSKPVTDFIIENNLQNRTVLMYNKIKPSIPFGLNKSIVSLKYDHHSLIRESQFETNDNYKNYLIDLNSKSEIETLQNIQKDKSVLLIYKQPIPENLNWLKSNYSFKKEIGKWRIYY